MTLIPLISEQTGSVPETWFEEIAKRNQTSFPHFMQEGTAVLKSYHDGKTDVTEAAHAITRPIVVNPKPVYATEFYGDSGEVEACQLYALLVDALSAWPSSRTHEIFSLLRAIKQIPDHLHQGQVPCEGEDDQEQPAAFKDVIGFLHMNWRDTHWMDPYDIITKTKESLDDERAVYIKNQDIEAQLIAEGFFQCDVCVISKLIDVLERPPRNEDDERSLSWDIPVVACWFRRIGIQILNELIREGRRSRGISKTLELDPVDRWAAWKQQLLDAAEDDKWDEYTRKEAKTALDTMQSVANEVDPDGKKCFNLHEQRQQAQSGCQQRRGSSFSTRHQTILIEHKVANYLRNVKRDGGSQMSQRQHIFFGPRDIAPFPFSKTLISAPIIIHTKPSKRATH